MAENPIRINIFSSLAFFAAFICILAMPAFTHAQDSAPQNVTRALITQVVSNTQISTGTDTPEAYNEVVMARILDGTQKGNIVEVQTSGIDGDDQAMTSGDIMYVISYPSADSSSIRPSAIVS